MENKLTSLLVMLFLLSYSDVNCTNKVVISKEYINAINGIVAGVKKEMDSTIAKQNADIKKSIIEIEKNQIDIRDSNDAIFRLFYVKEEACVMVKKYYLTYLKKIKKDDNWTVNYQIKLYLDINGNRVTKDKSVFQISPFNGILKTNKKPLIRFKKISNYQLSARVLVNEIVNPKDQMLKIDYLWIKTLLVANICQLQPNQEGKKLGLTIRNIYFHFINKQNKKRLLSQNDPSFYHNSQTNQNKLVSNMTLPMTESIDEGTSKTQSFNDNVYNLDQQSIQGHKPLNTVFAGAGLGNGHTIRVEGQPSNQVLFEGDF